MEKAIIVIGTRASALALWQAEYVKTALESAFPARRFVLLPVQTRGDLDHGSALSEIGTRGVFIKEIEDSLIAGEIDLGVHSLKDLPSELHPDLALAATSPREDPRDVVVSRGKLTLADLPAGARIGSSSPRRAAQVKAIRPDLTIENIRGNVDTRVRKVTEGSFDATILAAAGLHRLGLQESIAEYLPISAMLPAPCQGIIAVEARARDSEILEMARRIDDGTAHLAARAERAFVRGLGGGCDTPIGAYAEIMGDTLTIRGVLATPDGQRLLRETVTGDAASPEAAGAELARKIANAGGREILAELEITNHAREAAGWLTHPEATGGAS